MRHRCTLLTIAAVLALSACGSSSTVTDRPTASTGSSETTGPEPGTTDTTGETVDTTDTTAPTGDTAPGTDVPADDHRELVYRTWVVDGTYTIGGLIDVQSAIEATFVLHDDGMIAIDTGINSASGTVEFGPGRFTTHDLVTTEVGSTDEDQTSLEATIFAVLEHPVNWTVDGDQLTLTPIGVTDLGLHLHDTTAVDVPTPELDRLLSTTWIAQDFVTVGPLDAIDSSEHLSIAFDNSLLVEITAGCNVGAADVTLGSSSIEIGTLLQAPCTSITATQSRFLDLLTMPSTWVIDDDVLTIAPTNISDTGIRFRAATDTDTGTDTASTDRGRILVAAAIERTGADNSFGGQDAFGSYGVVDTLGSVDQFGTVRSDATSPAITDTERAAIEAALAPDTVEWLSAVDPRLVGMFDADVVGFDAVLRLGAPEIDGDAATIVTTLVCGGTCGIGGGHQLARADDGTWTVTGQVGVQWVS